MPVYDVDCLDRAGKKQSVRVRAAAEENVIEALRSRDLFPTRVRPARGEQFDLDADAVAAMSPDQDERLAKLNRDIEQFYSTKRGAKLALNAGGKGKKGGNATKLTRLQDLKMLESGDSEFLTGVFKLVMADIASLQDRDSLQRAAARRATQRSAARPGAANQPAYKNIEPAGIQK